MQNKKQADAIQYGKLPPQAVDVEVIVLGSMLMDKNAALDAIGVLSADDFYKDDHRLIFTSINDLISFDQPVDLLTVVENLKQKKQLEMVGGAYYISQLSNRVASTANVEFHARIIKQKSILRQIIRACSEGLNAAYEDSDDVFEVLAKIDYAFNDINNQTSVGKVSPFDKVLKSLAEDWKHREEHGLVAGVPSGFKGLDLVTGGFGSGNMIVLAGRPGMGKTAIALAIAKNASINNKLKVGVITLEMSEKELASRIITSETKINNRRLLKQVPMQDEYEVINQNMARLKGIEIYFVDRNSMTDQEFRVECRKLKRQHDVDLIILDYLQLMSTQDKKGTREQEVSTISRTIKSTAKGLEIPIIALSQLSRSVESRGGDKRPTLSDLRESGSIEQDADMVIFAYRPEYYDIATDEEGNSTSGVLELLIEKHRGGKTADIKLRCDLNYMIIKDFEDNNQPPQLDDHSWLTKPMQSAEF